MWVRIRTSTGLRALYEVAAIPEVEDLLDRETRPIKTRSVELNLPYVAVDYLRVELENRIYTTTGGRKLSSVRRYRDTHPLLARAMNQVLIHPALKGGAMVGERSELFPVWVQEPDRFGRRWSPTPNGGRYTVLWPEVIYRRGDRPTMTRWLPDPDIVPAHWLCEQALHELIYEAVRHR